MMEQNVGWASLTGEVGSKPSEVQLSHKPERDITGETPDWSLLNIFDIFA